MKGWCEIGRLVILCIGAQKRVNSILCMRRVSSLEQYIYLSPINQMHIVNILLLIATSTLISARLYLFCASDRLIKCYVDRLKIADDERDYRMKRNTVTMISSVLVMICGLYLMLAGYHGFTILEHYPIMCKVVGALGMFTWGYAAIQVYKYGSGLLKEYEYLSYKLRKLRYSSNKHINNIDTSIRDEAESLFYN